MQPLQRIYNHAYPVRLVPEVIFPCRHCRQSIGSELLQFCDSLPELHFFEQALDKLVVVFFGLQLSKYSHTVDDLSFLCAPLLFRSHVLKDMPRRYPYC